jgi:hypothetical protein
MQIINMVQIVPPISFEKVWKLKYPKCVHILHLDGSLKLWPKEGPIIKCII